jgi:hypothetical protein
MANGRPDPDVSLAYGTPQAISQKVTPQDPFNRLVAVGGEKGGTDDIGISGSYRRRMHMDSE